MSSFDYKVERMEEERVKKQNEKWNALLWKSVRTRTKQQVLRAMFDSLVIPVGSATLLTATRDEQLTLA